MRRREFRKTQVSGMRAQLKIHKTAYQVSCWHTIKLNILARFYFGIQCSQCFSFILNVFNYKTAYTNASVFKNCIVNLQDLVVSFLDELSETTDTNLHNLSWRLNFNQTYASKRNWFHTINILIFITKTVFNFSRLYYFAFFF